MTGTQTAGPRTRREIQEEILKDTVKEKREFNLQPLVHLAGMTVTAAGTYAIITYIAVPAFAAGGAWMVLGVAACLWSLGLSTVALDQFVKMIKAMLV